MLSSCLEMAWVRAVWVEDKVEMEEVLPREWVKDGLVYWPRSANARRLINMQKPPGKTWYTFPLKKIKFSSGIDFKSESFKEILKDCYEIDELFTANCIKYWKLLNILLPLSTDSKDDCEDYNQTTTDCDTAKCTDEKRQPKSKRNSDFLYEGTVRTL